MRFDRKNRASWLLAVLLAHSGDSWWWLTALFLIWLVDKFWKVFAGQAVEFAALLAIAVLSLAIFILAVKFIVRRSRPQSDWGDIYRRTDPHSFPSGHAARVFLIALLSFRFAPLWLGVMMIVWAILVSLARVVLGVHYLVDIIVGMVVGLLWGVIIILATPTLLSAFPFLFKTI